MITPRRTRLVRVPELQTFRHAIRALAVQGSTFKVQRSVILAPTRGAAGLLERSVDADVVTRDELYDRLQARLAAPPRRLTPLERDVMAQAAARATAARGYELSFQLRPGLVAEMLRFYDQLRRQSQQVQRFEELIDEALGSDEGDRAAQRMRLQTRFLAGAFRDYESRVRESGACDEHTLRERLMAEPAVDPVRHVIVTIPDWIADAEGLYQADFDLLTRVPGLESLDIVCTERVLASGFHERLHNWWPGLEEIDSAGPCATANTAQGFSPAKPVLITPPGGSPDEPWWTLRDREEELVAIARQLKADRRTRDEVPLERTAIVYKNPLPYLYAAAEIFRGAGIPYQMSDALPLAAEPTSAALDLILDTVSSRFSRSALIALLRSPHFDFGADVTRQAVSALDRALSAARYLGELDRLEALAGDCGTGASQPAMDAALVVARALAPLTDARPA